MAPLEVYTISVTLCDSAIGLEAEMENLYPRVLRWRTLWVYFLLLKFHSLLLAVIPVILSGSL